MSYEKTTWETGDVITAEKLNNIEDGIDGAVLVVNEVDGALNKTWKEINDAMAAGVPVFLTRTTEDGDQYGTTTVVFLEQCMTATAYETEAEGDQNGYTVEFTNGSYEAETENDYPQ